MTIEVLKCPGQIVPDEDQPERWQWHMWDVAQPGRPVRRCRRLRVLDWRRLWYLSQDLHQFFLQPWVQHHVWGVGHARGADLTSGGAEQGQQLGRTTADVLMRLTHRLALRPPGLTGLWDGLVRTGLILA